MASPATGRRYDNSRRQQEAAQTAVRIVEAGAALIRRSPVRDWSALTMGSVAAAAAVSERTVYRHFGTEEHLRAAVLRRLEALAGVDLDALSIDGVAGAATRILHYATGFPAGMSTDTDPSLEEADSRLRGALAAAVADARPDWDDDERRSATAVLDLLWHLTALERIVARWDLDEDRAIGAVSWVIDLVTQAIQDGRGPATHRAAPDTASNI